MTTKRKLDSSKEQDRLFQLYIECLKANPETMTHQNDDAAIDAACRAFNLYHILEDVFEFDEEEYQSDLLKELEGKN